MSFEISSTNQFIESGTVIYQQWFQLSNQIFINILQFTRIQIYLLGIGYMVYISFCNNFSSLKNILSHNNYSKTVIIQNCISCWILADIDIYETINNAPKILIKAFLIQYHPKLFDVYDFISNYGMLDVCFFLIISKAFQVSCNA